MVGSVTINGVIATDADWVLDRGLSYGDGLFETIAVLDGEPCLWSQHFDRLAKGSAKLGLPVPDQHNLLESIRRQADAWPYSIAKIIWTAGVAERGYARPENLTPTGIVSCAPRSAPFVARPSESLRASLCAIRLAEQPLLAGLKHLNRLEQVLARRELQCRGDFDEGVLLDAHDRVVEGIQSNLLVLTSDGWITPSLHVAGVEGIVRGLAMDIGDSTGDTVARAEFGYDELISADAVYMTNSLTGCRRVASIDDKVFPEPEKIPALIERVNAVCFKPDRGTA